MLLEKTSEKLTVSFQLIQQNFVNILITFCKTRKTNKILR